MAHRARVLVMVASVLVLMVSWLAADSGYEATSSAVPGLALATLATAVTYERRSRRTLAQQGEPVPSSPQGAPELAMYGSDAA
jgi:hypothetical protein